MTPKLLDLAPGVVCHKCGYDLRGFTEHQCCPECNEPVWLSASRRVGDLDRRRRFSGSARHWLIVQVCLAALLVLPAVLSLYVLVTGKGSMHPSEVFGSAWKPLRDVFRTSIFVLYCPPVAPCAVCWSAVMAVRAWGARALVGEHRSFMVIWTVSALIVASCIAGWRVSVWID